MANSIRPTPSGFKLDLGNGSCLKLKWTVEQYPYQRSLAEFMSNPDPDNWRFIRGFKYPTVILKKEEDTCTFEYRYQDGSYGDEEGVVAWSITLPFQDGFNLLREAAPLWTSYEGSDA